MKETTMRKVTVGIMIAAAILTILASILTLISLIWENLVVYNPIYGTIPAAKCVVQVWRREGFFYICHALKAGIMDVSWETLRCKPRSYGSVINTTLMADTAFSEIVDLRRTSAALVIIGLLFAIVALILLLIFVIKWYQEGPALVEYNPAKQLAVGSLLVFAGLSQQFGTMFLHINYMREKVLYSPNLPMIYTYWDQSLKRNTAISYSQSYWTLTSSICIYEAAGILVFISAVFIYILHRETQYEMTSGMTKVIAEGPMLPRFQEQAFNEEEEDAEPYYAEDN